MGEKKENVWTIIEAVKDEMCENYCRFRHMEKQGTMDYDRLLEKYCRYCPLLKM